ncbi:MAG TPA: hypothetical protein VMV79_04460 [Alphaproteobacteria bacterium]|nr:hypothetical protein [Alphaproteobacteria bacterium]
MGWRDGNFRDARFRYDEANHTAKCDQIQEKYSIRKINFPVTLRLAGKTKAAGNFRADCLLFPGFLLGHAFPGLLGQYYAPLRPRKIRKLTIEIFSFVSGGLRWSHPKILGIGIFINHIPNASLKNPIVRRKIFMRQNFSCVRHGRKLP